MRVIPQSVFHVFLALMAIVILVAMLMPSIHKPERKERHLTRIAVHNVTMACQAYEYYFGKAPAALADINHNPSNMVILELDIWPPKDFWGRDLIYFPPQGTNRQATVRSLGRDGRVGGQGLDGDIEDKFEMRP